MAWTCASWSEPIYACCKDCRQTEHILEWWTLRPSELRDKQHSGRNGKSKVKLSTNICAISEKIYLNWYRSIKNSDHGWRKSYSISFRTNSMPITKSQTRRPTKWWDLAKRYVAQTLIMRIIMQTDTNTATSELVPSKIKSSFLISQHMLTHSFAVSATVCP